jgi:hypothetical protein
VGSRRVERWWAQRERFYLARSRHGTHHHPNRRPGSGRDGNELNETAELYGRGFPPDAPAGPHCTGRPHPSANGSRDDNKWDGVALGKTNQRPRDAPQHERFGNFRSSVSFHPRAGARAFGERPPWITWIRTTPGNQRGG